MGAQCDEAGGNPICPPGTALENAAYVYQKSGPTWQNMVQVAKLTPSDGFPGDEFGAVSVAISGDTIVVSAALGKAYVFVKPALGWTNMTENAQLSVGFVASFSFPYVAIDGETIVLSSCCTTTDQRKGNGAAYVFTKPPQGWVTTTAFSGELTASELPFARLGGRTAISGDTIAVGGALGITVHGALSSNGAVYVFTKPSTGWKSETQTAILTESHPGPYDSLGSSLAISGQTIVAGDDQASPASYPYGAVYVFEMPSTGWVSRTETAELAAPANSVDQNVGSAVATDGRRVVVGGSSFPGEVYVYNRPGTDSWMSTSAPDATLVSGEVNSFFGLGLAIANDAIVVGAPQQTVGGLPYQGAGYVFEPTSMIDFSAGFGSLSDMDYAGSASFSGAAVELTDGGAGEAGSAFYPTRVNVQSFTTDFSFRLTDAAADGFTFTIQNVGPAALGSLGGGLGYRGIPHSVAVKFDLYDNFGEGNNSTGIYLDGKPPFANSINLNGSGINLHSGDKMLAHITYDGATLTLTITDAITAATWSHLFPVDIPTAVGSNTAYVGFTGGSGGLGATQQILAWSYQAGLQLSYFRGFLPATGLSLNGSSTFDKYLNGSNITALELTNSGLNEAGSAFFSAPVNIQSFTTDFTFLLTDAVADGFTFTIQNAGPSALGSQGGGLGYRGIPLSVAIKFDLYDNFGEGNNSTGIYLDGKPPFAKSIDLNGSGINLHSGDLLEAYIEYDGESLHLTLTDHFTLTKWSYSFPVDVPGTVGGNMAYVGFTGSTGSQAANQQIFSWLFQ